MTLPLLDISNVSKLFQKNQVLHQVNLSVSKNEIVGLVGPNGVGKTTMMRLALGTLKPDAGVVKRYQQTKNQKNSLRLGYMPEISPLFETYKVEPYLRLISKIKKLSDSYRFEEIERIISQFDLTAIRGRTLGNLSKGTKQRVGLAQAFLGSPDLILLDEPFSGLDPIQSKEIKDIVVSASKKAGIFLSTHLIHDVVTLCDRAYLLNQTKIFELDIANCNEDTLTSQIIDLIKGKRE